MTASSLRLSAGFVLCMIASLHATAQIWCPPGATWIYDTGSPWTAVLTRHTYVGDTLVDGHPSQRIEVDGLISNWFGNDTSIHTYGPDVVTRLSGEAVLLWRPATAAWDTLHWFGAEVGDHWRPPWAFEEDCPADHSLVVLETGTMVVDGVELRKLLVEHRQGSEPFGGQEWIAERMGPLNGFFLPVSECEIIVECYCTFWCYRDHEIGAGDCALPLALSQHQDLPSALELWPNPGSDRLWVEGPIGMQAPSVVRVLDGKGAEIGVWPLVNNAMEVDATTWPPGLYLIELVVGHHRSTAKWMKQ